MKGKTLCIVIALMVLSISAILVANPGILGGFSSTLNMVDVKVTISGSDLPFFIPELSVEDLRQNWREHEGRIVKFTGRVVDEDPLGPSFLGRLPEKLILEGYPFVEVYLLDSPNLEPYELGDEYGFVGFLMSYERHLPFEDRGARVLRVYAFKSWPLEAAEEDEDANPKDGGETK